MKENREKLVTIKGNKKINTFFAIAAAAIIILAAFTTIAYFQLNVLTTAKEEEESLPLIAFISADKTSGAEPLEVNFVPIVKNSVGKTEYYWDFGDGNTSNEENPIYTYTGNISYNCSLQVTDSTGKEASDLMTIIVMENHKPTVSIEYITDKPRRPRNIFLEFLFSMIFHMDTFDAEDYRELLDKGRLDRFFRNIDSFYSLEASASDEDGDEIVSYNWTLRPPPYTTRFGGEPRDPKYYFSGKKIEIPAKYIYPSQQYSITVTVTDSAGKIRSESLKFQVQKSHEKSRIESRLAMITNQITNWISVGRTGAVSGPLGRLFLGLIIIGLLSKLPLARLIGIILIKLILQTDPDFYSDYKDLWEPLKDWTDNRTWAYNLVNKTTEFLQKNNPEFANRTAWFFGAEDMEDLREKLDLENKRPKVTNPSPQDGAILVDLNTSKVWITILDDVKENDRFNVSIYGEYINTTDNHYVNYTNVNNSDGPFSAPLITPLPPSTEIEWKVTVVEPDYVNDDPPVKKVYKFTTAYE